LSNLAGMVELPSTSEVAQAGLAACEVTPPLQALVVDDVKTYWLVLRAHLRSLGFVVREAEDGAAGVAVVRETLPDVILMDVMMPVMDGYQAATEIKRICGETFVPILFLPATGDDEAIERCISSGGDDYLCKPFEPRYCVPSYKHCSASLR